MEANIKTNSSHLRLEITKLNQKLVLILLADPWDKNLTILGSMDPVQLTTTPRPIRGFKLAKNIGNNF